MIASSATVNSAKEPARAGDRSPWLWVPTLYFAQGIPYVAVMSLSVIMYKRLGISNTDIALYTSLLNLPWVLKPLWSPVVDIFKTKRQWIVVLQFVIALTLAAVGVSLQTSLFFGVSLAVFWLMAFSSSTHDIAADGFYMLGLNKHDQAWFVGVRSTFFRLAMIVGSGLLVMLAGALESKNGLAPVEIAVKTGITPGSSRAAHNDLDGDSLRLIASPGALEFQAGIADKVATEALVSGARSWNLEHGFSPKPTPQPTSDSFWSKHVSGPIGDAWSAHVSEPTARLLRSWFPQKPVEKAANAGQVQVVQFELSKAPEKPVVVSLSAQPEGLARIGIGSADRGFKLIEGERFVFTPQNWNQPFKAVIQIDPRVTGEISGRFVARAGNIPLAWSVTLFVLAGVFMVSCLWHSRVLPKTAIDGPVVSGKSIGRDFLQTLGSFFRKPGIGPALTFILFYRFAEAQSVKLLAPFLLDSRTAGGLGLTTGQVGFAYGTIGVLALTLGGILGGFLGARHGLKRVLPIMVCAIHLPNLVFVYLSQVQPENLMVINMGVALEQFGYGFGFTAYMLFLLHFAEGEHATAHYAICTGLMALGMMIPGFFSGWLQEILGYRQFFIWVMLATIPGFLVAFFVNVEKRSATTC